MVRFAAFAIFAAVLPLPAQSPFFALKDVKAGMRGVGRTVFAGDRVEEFQVEILGVLENIGPKQSLILGKLSGGPLGQTGVMQGMSGSPVYIGGKLVGAVAMAFPYSKEPITGIRPIDDMLEVGTAPTRPSTLRASIQLNDRDLTRVLPRPEAALAGEARLMDIATPISFGGFTRNTLDYFAPQLRSLGLEPRQGLSGGGSSDARIGNPSAIKPGSMISVQLMTGDLSIGADGTVTYVDGTKIYAFGHRFLSIGSTALPFARAEVLTLLPALNVSFKLSTSREWMGTMFQDRNTAVAGELGRKGDLAPVSIKLTRPGARTESYRMQIVGDPLLSPLLVQMAVYSAIDATERTVGAGTFRMSADIEFQNAPAPVRLRNMYTADNGSAALASLSAAIPMAYVMQSGFDGLALKRVAIEIEAIDETRQAQIDGVWAARRTVRPGETVELTVSLIGENGAEIVRRVPYKVPDGTTPGPLFFTVADGTITNFGEIRQWIGVAPRSPRQVIATVNKLRGNTRAYVRVWRPEAAFQLEGEDFPSPPPSAAMIFGAPQSALAGMSQTRNSKLAEIEVDAGDVVISGSRTIQVEVKE